MTNCLFVLIFLFAVAFPQGRKYSFLKFKTNQTYKKSDNVKLNCKALVFQPKFFVQKAAPNEDPGLKHVTPKKSTFLCESEAKRKLQVATGYAETNINPCASGTL